MATEKFCRGRISVIRKLSWRFPFVLTPQADLAWGSPGRRGDGLRAAWDFLWPVRAKPNSLALRGWASSPWTAVPVCSMSPGSALPPDHPESPHPFHSLASPWVAQGLPSILGSELSLLNSFDLGSEISPSSHSRCCFAGSVAPESEPPLPAPGSGLPWHLPWPAFLSTPWEGLLWRNPCLPGLCLGGPPA